MFTELPTTTKLLDQYPYEPFSDPAMNIAERLIALGHLSYNRNVWAASPERIKKYWTAYTENIEGSANTNKVSVWWTDLSSEMAFEKLNKEEYLHEQNLLLNPTQLSIPVADQDILQVFRQQTGYLIDRARMWVKVRNATRKDSHS